MKKTKPSSAESYEAWQRRQDATDRRIKSLVACACLLGAAAVIIGVIFI